LSRAKNQGIADGTAAIVAFTDDDCRVEPGWLAALTAPLRSGEAGAVAGRTLPESRDDGGEETFSFYRPEGPVRFSRWTHPWRVGGGGNFAARREVLREIGPYDERFGPGAPLESAEDMDLVHRLLRSGHRIVYAPAAVVWHRSWRSPAGNRRLSRAYGVGTGAYFTKHLLAGDLISGWRFVQRGGVRTAHLLQALIRGDRRRVAEQAVYLAGMFQGLARYGSGLLPRRPATPRLEGRNA
jgi:GT2 family glycosyltransferase